MPLSSQITNAYVKTTSQLYESLIKNRGQSIRNYLTPLALPVPCESFAVPQFDIGAAYNINSGSEPIKASPISTGKRVMRPKPYGNAISLDGYDSRRAQLPSEEQLAEALANSMTIFSDNLAIRGFNGVGGIEGSSRSEERDAQYREKLNYIKLNMTNVIAVAPNAAITTIPEDSNIITWNNLAYTSFKFKDFGANPNLGQLPETDAMSYAGLSGGKLLMATAHLQKLQVPPPYVCICSSAARASSYADPILRNVTTNWAGPLMSQPVNAPFAGIQYFIETEAVTKNVPSKYQGNAIQPVEYAYIFNPSYVYFGATKIENLSMEAVPGVWDQVIIKTDAMYDVMRTQEKAVVIIEINTNNAFSSFNV